ncbi:MAG: ClpXP protease specificity-enhancing factor SspB [Tabrizicola sp.]
MTPKLADLARTFARIGCLSFGGPAAQIALMHRIVLDEKRWVSEPDYLRALSFCMLLPGPEAMQLATWIGWRLHGVRGGLIAGGLFVLPGAAVVLALSLFYAALGEVPVVAALFAGVQAAVIAIVIEALIRVSKRALKSREAHIIATGAFLGLFALDLPFPVIILVAGLWGFFRTASARRGAAAPAAPAALARSLRAAAVWLAIWLAPLGALILASPGRLAEIGIFFSKLAVLTFGGAYAVLAWMAQEVVQDKGWLTLKQMIDGLGLAETTPGPLILVNAFVGFLAAHGVGGWTLGLAGAAVALWMTFVPSFLFIFAGAPFIDRLTHMPRLSAALAAITAAVVGVIANLSLWFALHVLFAHVPETTLGPLHLTWPDPTSLRRLGDSGPALEPGRRAGSFGARLGPGGGSLTPASSGARPPLPLVSESPMLQPNRERTALMARTIDYGNLMHKAMRGLIQSVLAEVAEHGLPGAHHFFITFDTTHPGVQMADWLKERYPTEMTVVLQHWFENLKVTDDGFSVTLNFGNSPEPMVIPFDALRTFVDPSVEFGLRFETQEQDEDEVEEEQDIEVEPEAERHDAEIVSLDQFRKH